MKRRPLIPVLPVVLLLMWLLLNDSASPGHIALGAVFAVLITLAVARLRPLPAWPHRLHVAVGLIGHVLIDIVRSNLAVGRIILGASRRQPTIGFMKIPLDMRDPHGLAMLAVIITGTPGTVWGGHDAESNVLTLHVLDLKDEAAWVRTIKQRYERPLMEIFE
ncbi:MAG: Na+/H+ antiporter subunit E [Thiobacillus sp.]|jgi:multicomponent K+:H+ antiporter subunit E|uniref:Na+/H+ antiporter subunit E n=1 Tax=Thiobacillus sp. TaxID=924 RepID=UPI002895DD0D|nr:Na+/H+ antiporter subunit E [Thiobacillus sp.]MDT3708083.1 Na+/H+ antiporter subunit E [Thiobacillus sp.]